MISFAETSFEELPDGNLDWLSNVSYNVMGLQHSLISNMDLGIVFEYLINNTWIKPFNWFPYLLEWAQKPLHKQSIKHLMK